MKNEFLIAISKRFITSLIIIFLLVTFIFLLLRLAPGDPTQKFISPQLSPELANKVAQSFNLDKPLLSQYYNFVINLLTGDFGFSYNYRQPVLLVIKDYFLFTLFFASVSFILQLLIAYFLIKISLRKTGGILDKSLSKISLIFFAVPSFVLGLILVYIFSVQLDWLPTSGIKSIFHDDFSFTGKIWDYSIHLTLPLITLSLAGIAVFYRYLRDSVAEIYNQSYIVNLRANGYTEKEIFKKHIIPNAVRPLISVAGIEFGILLGGALITEVIFSLPGMGRLTVNAIFNRDFPLVIGCSFIAGLMMILTNFIADLIKIKIDKRLLKDLLQ
jgi:peptide/nickel transport system permease protein